MKKFILLILLIYNVVSIGFTQRTAISRGYALGAQDARAFVAGTTYLLGALPGSLTYSGGDNVLSSATFADNTITLNYGYTGVTIAENNNNIKVIESSGFRDYIFAYIQNCNNLQAQYGSEGDDESSMFYLGMAQGFEFTIAFLGF